MQKHVPDTGNPFADSTEFYNSDTNEHQPILQDVNPVPNSEPNFAPSSGEQNDVAPSLNAPQDALSKLLEQSDAQVMAFEPILRQSFGHALLTSKIFVPVERDGENMDGSISVSLQAALLDDVPHVLLFSSLDLLIDFCQPESDYAEVYGFEVVQQVRGHFAVLNAGQSGRAFTPKDIEEFLESIDEDMLALANSNQTEPAMQTQKAQATRTATPANTGPTLGQASGPTLGQNTGHNSPIPPSPLNIAPTGQAYQNQAHSIQRQPVVGQQIQIPVPQTGQRVYPQNPAHAAPVHHVPHSSQAPQGHQIQQPIQTHPNDANYSPYPPNPVSAG